MLTNSISTKAARTLAFGLLVLFPIYAFATDPDKKITQYAHTTWRTQDGYFSGAPHAITQTADGYIWIGTQNELLRFDGVKLARWIPPAGRELPQSRIWTLLGSRDGSLWIGTDTGLAHWNNRELVIFAEPHGHVNSIIEKSNGEIWFSVVQQGHYTAAVCQVIGERTKCYGTSEGLPVRGATALAEDASGNLWFGDESTVVRWNGSSSRTFSPQALKGNHADGVVAIAGAPDGSVWLGFAVRGPGVGLQKVVNDVPKPFVTPELDSSTLIVNALFLDRHNSLWIGTEKQGIYRIHDRTVDHFGSGEGLSSDFVAAFHEDREGDMWVATSQGVDCFRNLRVSNFTAREGLPMEEVDSVLASRDGTVWAGGPENLASIKGGKVSWVQSHKGLPGTQVTSLFEDHAGRLWVGVDNSLFIYEKGAFRPIRRRDGSSIGFITDLAEDGHHNVWAETIGPRKLVRITDLIVQEEFPEPQIPAAHRVAVGPDESIWLGLFSGDLARYNRGKVDIFPFKNSSSPSRETMVNALLVAPEGAVLGATSFGLIAWKAGKQQILTVKNGLPCNVIYSLITDNNGALWLYTQCGIVEIPKVELEKWWEDPGRVLEVQTVGAVDGAQPGWVPFQGAAISPDGKLWFANYTALQVIDPANRKVNSIPPPLVIQDITADKIRYEAGNSLSFPANTRDLQIDYAALSFANPQKVAFRYKLEGRDNKWQDAGSRRQAFYTDLPPGHYTFRVIGSNNDAVWNEEGAFLDFAIAPAYHQTWWFRLSCVIAFAGLLWALYQLRLRQMTQEFNMRLEERVHERTRIARELHDTLLQSFHGLLLRFQAVSNELDKGEHKEELDEAIDRAAQAITEGRNAVQGLRASVVETNDLAAALGTLGKELAAAESQPPEFVVQVEGGPRELHPVLRDEVYRVGGEALRNAFRHSNARHIEVEVRYDERQFRLRVRDDGKGIESKLLAEHGRAGHFGLRGIRERAERVGGKLTLWSSDPRTDGGLESGTEVELRIPAAHAYAKLRAPRLRSWLAEKFFGKQGGMES